MTRLSDEELQRLRLEPESELVERKRSGGDRSSIRRNICAFANDLHGYRRPGVILIGVEDDGRCVQLRVDDEFLRTLAQMRSDGNILPLPSMSVERRVLDGCPVAVIVVEPSADPPVRYQGRTWVKVGPTVREATPEEERRLVERRRAGNLPFDMRSAQGATLEEDLDLDYLAQQYLPRAVAAEVLERNGRPLAERSGRSAWPGSARPYSDRSSALDAIPRLGYPVRTSSSSASTARPSPIPFETRRS